MCYIIILFALPALYVGNPEEMVDYPQTQSIIQGFFILLLASMQFWTSIKMVDEMGIFNSHVIFH